MGPRPLYFVAAGETLKSQWKPGVTCCRARESEKLQIAQGWRLFQGRIPGWLGEQGEQRKLQPQGRLGVSAHQLRSQEAPGEGNSVRKGKLPCGAGTPGHRFLKSRGAWVSFLLRSPKPLVGSGPAGQGFNIC